MDNEKLNTQLYEKVFSEQEKYRNRLLSQEPAEILNHTYEYTIREDILMSLECNDLTDAQARVLLQSPDALSDMFHEFENQETNHMDNVLDCITGRADTLIQRQREELLNTPVYNHPGAYAREHDELPLYHASNKANIACKEAIEAVISEHYYDNRLNPGGVQQVVEQFGMERTCYVLANTVKSKDWDARISRDNKQWAKTIPVVENTDPWGQNRNCYFVVDRCNPGLTDLFMNQTRREIAALEQAKERKPSVLDKLKAAQQPSVPSAALPKKAKGMEL